MAPSTITNWCLFMNLLIISPFGGTGTFGSAVSRDRRLRLEITPPGAAIVLTEGDNLNLTCCASFLDNTAHRDVQIDLSWHLPTQPDKGMYWTRNTTNRLGLFISHMQVLYSGVYICKAESRQDGYVVNNKTIIVVKPKGGRCARTQFMCGSGECIFKRYTCDNVSDCRDGSDEAVEKCGEDPCGVRKFITCQSGRCMDGRQCCDAMVNPDCVHFFKEICCQEAYDGNEHHLTGSEVRVDVPQMSAEQHQVEMHQLRCTVYTIIGCSVGFVIILSFMIVIVCRYHMRRRLRQHIFSCPHCAVHAGQHVQRQRCCRQSRWRPYSLRPAREPHRCPGTTNLLVTYNINNGLQILPYAEPLRPPPYEQIANQESGVEADGRDSPPPAYQTIDRRANLSVITEIEEEREGARRGQSRDDDGDTAAAARRESVSRAEGSGDRAGGADDDTQMAPPSYS